MVDILSSYYSTYTFCESYEEITRKYELENNFLKVMELEFFILVKLSRIKQNRHLSFQIYIRNLKKGNRAIKVKEDEKIKKMD